MADYKKIKELCEFNSVLTNSVVDEFLLHYAAEKDKSDKKAKVALSRYRHITKKMPDGWYGMAMAQYMAHRIFRKDGLIQRYAGHSAMDRLDSAQQSWMELLKEHPWRFLFSEIIDSPAKDFYTMEDVFEGEHYLLYSPGTTQELQSGPVPLWFNLISWNGACWQTYGTIVPLRGMEFDDICYFTHRLYPRLDLEEAREPMTQVEKDPVPYMMLYCGSQYPLVFHENIQTVYTIAEYEDDSFHTGELDQAFKIEYAKGVYRLGLNGWDTFPHFAAAYYNESKKVLFLSAFSDDGFDRLVKALVECGYELSVEADFRVNPAMHATANEILKSKDPVIPYEKYFPRETEEEKEESGRVNEALQKLIPDINAGRKPNIQAVAREAGMDPGDLQEFVDNLKKKIGR
ncbi:MAG: hypothetical protein WD097_05510 [Balneolales bacterium]